MRTKDLIAKLQEEKSNIDKNMQLAYSTIRIAGKYSPFSKSFDIDYIKIRSNLIDSLIKDIKKKKKGDVNINTFITTGSVLITINIYQDEYIFYTSILNYTS